MLVRRYVRVSRRVRKRRTVMHGITLLVTRIPHKQPLNLMTLIVIITTGIIVITITIIIIIRVHKAITERINAMLHG